MGGSVVGEGVVIVFRVEVVDVGEETMRGKKKIERELQIALIPCKDNSYLI